MRGSLSADDIWDLANATAVALHKAFKDHKLSEPQLVANLVKELPEQINKIAPTGARKVTAGGVFVHAQPFVTCKSFPAVSPSSVEIGDLLLIRTLVENKTVVERRALLLQAKKADSIPATPDNPNQWHLYEKWPPFTYAARSGKLTGKPRHIKEPDMYDAAKYLLIGSGTSPMHCAAGLPSHWLCHMGIGPHHTAQPTKPAISRYSCFFCELLNFLVGNGGKVFDKPASRARGWNRVIHDLITETAKAKTIFMGRSAGLAGKATRGSGLFFMTEIEQPEYFLVASGENAGRSSPPPDMPSEWMRDGEGNGISIIEIIVDQGEG